MIESETCLSDAVQMVELASLEIPEFFTESVFGKNSRS